MTYHYGLRVYEATMLTLENVDLKNHRIKLRRLKNGLGARSRCGGSNTANLLRAYLRARRDAGPYLFTGREGTMKKRMIQHLFDRSAEAADISGRSVHALRHSVTVHLLNARCGIEYVADHLGHKNIQNIRIYAQISHPLASRSSATSSGARKSFGSRSPRVLRR